jgi:predicted protein tyrosine phosphatase
LPLSVCGLPELEAQLERGITHVLSLLDPGNTIPSILTARQLAGHVTVMFDDVVDVSPGKIAPNPGHIATILRFGREIAARPDPYHLLVHCHAGLSRSTAAAALLIAQAQPRLSGAEVLGRVINIRPMAWPSLLMMEIGDELLGRGGELVRAAHARYDDLIRKHPQIIERMVAAGRAREIASLSRCSEARPLSS